MSATSKGRVSIGTLATTLVCAATLPGTAAAGIRKRRFQVVGTLCSLRKRPPLLRPTHELCRLIKRDSCEGHPPLRSDDGAAEIGSGSPATVQMAQEVSKTDGVVHDGGASQPGTTLLQVRIDVANAQPCKILLIGARPE